MTRANVRFLATVATWCLATACQYQPTAADPASSTPIESARVWFDQDYVIVYADVHQSGQSGSVGIPSRDSVPVRIEFRVAGGFSSAEYNGPKYRLDVQTVPGVMVSFSPSATDSHKGTVVAGGPGAVVLWVALKRNSDDRVMWGPYPAQAYSR